MAFAPRAGLAYSMADNKMVVRAGAGLIYGHVPLLATDFAGYQERMITISCPAVAPSEPSPCKMSTSPRGLPGIPPR